MRDYKNEIAAYLDEVKNREKDNLDKILDNIEEFKYVCIFGAGMTSQTLIPLWKRNIDKKIDFLCDNDKTKWGKIFHGDIVCISPDELKKYKDEVAVIIATRFIKEIYMQLKEEGFSNIHYIGDYRLGSRSFLKNKKNIDIIKDNIVQMLDVLEDTASKDILVSLIKIWFDYDVTGLEYSSIYSGDEYYPDDIIKLRENESFVDAGAYTGDSVISFLKKVNYSFDSIFAFELDKENFKALEFAIKDLDKHIIDKIHLYNVGVFDEEKTISYEHGNEKGANYHISNSIFGMKQGKTVRLSDILNGERVSFIKMDIEGAELNALYGAEELIKKYKPALAICVYHKPEHLWEIPSYIKKIVPEYKLYLRHHSSLEYQTVCYAVCKD